MVDPGMTTVIKIKYKLPFRLDTVIEPSLNQQIKDIINPSHALLVPYTILIQKQSSKSNLMNYIP